MIARIVNTFGESHLVEITTANYIGPPRRSRSLAFSVQPLSGLNHRPTAANREAHTYDLRDVRTVRIPLDMASPLAIHPARTTSESLDQYQSLYTHLKRRARPLHPILVRFAQCVVPNVSSKTWKYIFLLLFGELGRDLGHFSFVSLVAFAQWQHARGPYGLRRCGLSVWGKAVYALCLPERGSV